MLEVPLILQSSVHRLSLHKCGSFYKGSFLETLPKILFFYPLASDRGLRRERLLAFVSNAALDTNAFVMHECMIGAH